MTSTRSAAATSPVITAARAFQELETQAAAGKLATAAEWAEAHPALFDADVAFGAEAGVPLAGAGAPLVAEFAVVQFATVLGLSQAAGRSLIGTALELKHRLPRTWARVLALEVPAWRARRLAERTMLLSAEAADWVDAQLAAFAHGLSWAQQERTIEQAIDRFLPHLADQRREDARDGRHVTVDHDGAAFAGTAHIRAEVDLADAIDFDHALAQGAEQQRRLGSTESLDVRRAIALGELARNQRVLDLSAQTEQGSGEAAAPTAGPVPRREAVLYLHLDPATDRGWLEGHGTPLLTGATIRDWLSVPGARATVRPVLDLNQPLATDAYAPTPLLREQAILINPTCVFPCCSKPARHTDLDHIIAFDAGGRTITINLAPLCRLHHRVKTHDGWTYHVERPGSYLWTDPLGFKYRVEAGVTTRLSPRLFDPGGHPPDQ